MGCYDYQVPLGKVFNEFRLLVCILLIFVGLVMTFAGHQFLFYVLSLVIGVAVTGIAFFLNYNLFIDVHSSSSKTWTIILLILSIAFGVAFVIFTHDFNKQRAIPIVASCAGVFGGLSLFHFLWFSSFWIKLIFIIGGAFAGSYVGNKFQPLVKTVGTAFIGAILVLFGISHFAPEHFKNGHSLHIGAWIIMVLLWVAGSYYQWQSYQAAEQEEADEEAEEKVSAGYDAPAEGEAAADVEVAVEIQEEK